jgi:tripartite-type tricarboxylate transporter receptor subunit TctC
MDRRHFAFSLICAPLATNLPAQERSSSRITVIVPFPPGGGADALARKLAELLAPMAAAAVVVDNIPGASGSLAAQRLLASPPDGNTLMVVSSSETIMPPLMLSSVRYKAEDFRLVSRPLHAPVALLARPDFPARSLAELLGAARDKPAPSPSYGSLGPGTVAHLAAEHFSRLTGIEMLHVPYRGGAPLISDLLADRVDLSFLPLAGPTLQLVEAGRLQLLGIASRNRVPRLARHPLLTEHPALKNFVHSAWNAVALPSSVPAPTAKRIHRLVEDVMETAPLRDFVDGLGSHVGTTMTLEEAERFYQDEITSTRALAATIHLQPL